MRAQVLGLAGAHVVARAVQVVADFGFTDMLEQEPRTAAALARAGCRIERIVRTALDIATIEAVPARRGSRRD
jgi:hypothetical protein